MVGVRTKASNAFAAAEQVDSPSPNPFHDRDAALTDYGEAHGLGPSNWVFLSSAADQPEDTTRRVAKANGLEFTEVDEMQMHGVVTHVIDREGRPRGRFHGLGLEPVSLVTFGTHKARNPIRIASGPGSPTFGSEK